MELLLGLNDAAYALAIAYDPDAQKYAVLMDEYIAASGYNGHIQEITISGTTPVIGGKTVFLSSRISASGAGLSYDTSSDTFLLSFGNAAVAPNYESVGKSMTLKLGSSNLTAENFVGITNGVVVSNPQSVGSEAVFESAGVEDISSAYDSNAQKVVFAYTDAANNNYGTAVVGTVSGTSISFGTPVVFEAAIGITNSIVFDSNSNKVVISYKDGGNSYNGTSIVGTVSGTTISFGSPRSI